MNGKKAKRLRRQAKEATQDIGVEYNEYYAPQFHVERDEKTGLVKNVTKVVRGTPLVMDDCERRLYKDLKNGRVERRKEHEAKGLVGLI